MHINLKFFNLLSNSDMIYPQLFVEILFEKISKRFEKMFTKKFDICHYTKGRTADNIYSDFLYLYHILYTYIIYYAKSNVYLSFN